MWLNVSLWYATETVSSGSFSWNDCKKKKHKDKLCPRLASSLLTLQNVFSHSQLYVTLSRIRNPKRSRILSKRLKDKKNIMNSIVYFFIIKIPVMLDFENDMFVWNKQMEDLNTAYFMNSNDCLRYVTQI